MDNITLPYTNEYGYFEMRLESIGGFGANLCGKLLGELGALYLKLNAASFSSYGSEKRGSPVKAYIRFSMPEKEIRINSPVIHPHILAIFHEALLSNPTVLSGTDEHTKVIINTDISPDKITLNDNLKNIFVIDAQKIALEEKSRINMIMLGAICKVSEFIPLDAAKKLITDTLGKKYPSMINANIRGLERGFNEIRSCIITQKNNEPQNDIPSSHLAPEGISDIHSVKTPSVTHASWGYINAPLGGINPCIGSTVSNDLSASREGYIPLFIPEKCINCGLCDSTCPDMVFQFEKGIYKDRKGMVNKGLDYSHCKGCMRCVEICPTNALVQIKERDYKNPPFALRNKDLLPEKLDYETSGASSYITSESYMTEKRVDGGLV